MCKGLLGGYRIGVGWFCKGISLLLVRCACTEYTWAVSSHLFEDPMQVYASNTVVAAPTAGESVVTA